MFNVYEVVNVPLGRKEAITMNAERAMAVFEKEIADPINRRCHIELRMDGKLIDHAGGGWERGCLVRA